MYLKHVKHSLVPCTHPQEEPEQKQTTADTGCFVRRGKEMKASPQHLTAYSSTPNVQIIRHMYGRGHWNQCRICHQQINKGWQGMDSCLQPVLMTKAPAPESLLQLTVCHCKKSLCRRASCASRKNDMPCTEGCACFANEACENPRTGTVLGPDDDDDDDDV